MQEIKRAKRLSQAFAHFVTARASLFTDHEISGRPIRAKYRLRTICEQTVDKSPTDPTSVFFFFKKKIGGHPYMASRDFEKIV